MYGLPLSLVNKIPFSCCKNVEIFYTRLLSVGKFGLVAPPPMKNWLRHHSVKHSSLFYLSAGSQDVRLRMNVLYLCLQFKATGGSVHVTK